MVRRSQPDRANGEHFSWLPLDSVEFANRQLEHLVDGFCFCFTLSSHAPEWPAVQLQDDQRVRSNIYSSMQLM